MGLFVRKNQENDAEIKAVAGEVFGDGKEFSRYFMNVSVIYRIFEFLLLGIFLVYMIVSAVNNVENIRYENLEYIVRNFAFELDENESNATPIRYNPDGTLRFSLYGKGLAVCGKSDVSIFSATGRKTYAGSHDYAEPMLTASSKYVYSYDLAGVAYAVYNNFSKVYSGNTDHPIREIIAADNGNYAIITRTDDYTSGILLYDGDFNLIGRYMKNGYIISADLNEDNILICTLTTDENGEFTSELMLCAIGSDLPMAKVNVNGSFPIRCWMINDGFGIITDDKVAMFTEKGFPIEEYGYKGEELFSCDVSENGCAVLFCRDRMNKEYELIVLNDLCRKMNETVINEKPRSVEMYGDSVYLLAGDGIIRIDRDETYRTDIENGKDGLEIVAYSDKKVYFCGQTSAEVLTVSQN